jgi:hypothetical protein
MKKILVLTILLVAAGAQAGLLEDSGVKGGLIVVVGCDDAKLIGELGRSDSERRRLRQGKRRGVRRQDAALCGQYRQPVD